MSLSYSICIGSYKMMDMLRLNTAYCRRVFGEDVPILISDDLSSESNSIKAFSEDSGFAYMCSPSRRGHFLSDLQTIVLSIVFAESCRVDCGIKLSQRYIPIHADFRLALERAMENPKTMICLPGSILPQQVARPGSSFFSKFAIMTDVIAIRTGAISGQEIRDGYADQFERGTSHADALVEVFVHRLICDRFQGEACARLETWSNHIPFKERLFLRRSQNLHADYIKAAEAIGIHDFIPNLAEWLAIEKTNYLCRPSCV